MTRHRTHGFSAAVSGADGWLDAWLPARPVLRRAAESAWIDAQPHGLMVIAVDSREFHLFPISS